MFRSFAALSALLAFPFQLPAQTFVDDFNRPDAPNLGPNWQVIGTASATRTISDQAGNVAGANNLSLVTPANFSADYMSTRVTADIFHTGVVGTGFVALAFGHNGVATVGQGLYIKVQSQSGVALFNNVGFYTGVGQSSTVPWTDPPIFFSAGVTPFTSARMSVWASDATTINLGLDTDFNGVDDMTFSRHLNLAAMTFGNQVGLGVFGTNSRADDFVATVTVIPEPSLLAAVPLLALLARRRRTAA